MGNYKPWRAYTSQLVHAYVLRGFWKGVRPNSIVPIFRSATALHQVAIRKQHGIVFGIGFDTDTFKDSHVVGAVGVVLFVERERLIALESFTAK